MKKYDCYMDEGFGDAVAEMLEDDTGEFYRVADVDARIAELERLLKEAHYFVSEDFPNESAATLKLENCCVTPRYFKYWQDLNQALGQGKSEVRTCGE